MKAALIQGPLSAINRKAASALHASIANRDSRPENTLPIWESGSCSLSFFVGKDVAKALEYSNTRDAIGKHVDNEDKGVVKCDTLGGSQDLSVINESGLYSLILSSKLPQAKAFKRWVTSEVLPQIRKKRERTGHSCRQRGQG